ncbi:MAG: peptidase M4 family protein [Acidobacteria bacterium]|nr:peptidase M4 family protein [Acidobacteriota bacterium]
MQSSLKRTASVLSVMMVGLIWVGWAASPSTRHRPLRSVDQPVRTPMTQPAVLIPQSITSAKSAYSTPMYLRGALGAITTEDPVAAATSFLKTFRCLLKLEDGDNDFQLLTASRDDLGMAHVKFQHVYSGIPVWPEQVIVHVNTLGQVYCFNGIYQNIHVDALNPGVPADEAENIARQSQPCPVDIEASTKLVIYNFHTPAPTLAWEVEMKPLEVYPYHYRVFVNAKTGEITNSIDEVYTGYATTSSGILIHNSQAVTLDTWHYDDGYTYLIDASKSMFPGYLDVNTFQGTIVILDKSSGWIFTPVIYDPNLDNTFNDNYAIMAGGTASYHVSEVYDYFYDTHNWTGFSNTSGSIKVYVNDISNLDNAYYVNNSITLGAGGVWSNNWAAALDLTAHEYAHGVTDATCRLVYQYESGAMNESMSDVIGCLVDDANWTLGEIIIKTNPLGATAFRNMADPHNGQPTNSPLWQPAHMSEFVSMSVNDDNGGVHKNCGIPNKAFYLTAASIGRSKAERIYFRAWTNYFTANTDFSAARLAIEQAAIDLHGNNSAEHNAVKSAFDAVGIAGGAGPADDYFLYFPLAANFEYFGKTFDNTLWIINTQDQTVHYALDLYNWQGAGAGTTGNRTLAAHAMEGWIMPDNSNMGIATADGRIIGICDHKSPDGYVAVSTTPAEIFTNAIFIPHIPSTYPVWFSLCGIANVTDTVSDVIYLDNDDKGALFDLAAPYSSAFFDFELLYMDLYGELPDPAELGGLWGFFANYDLDLQKVLEPNLVGTEIFGLKATNDCAGLNLDPFVGRTLLFSHIANPPQGWWTGIAMVSLSVDPDPNDAVTTHPILITAYTEAGEMLKQTVTEIPYLGKMAYQAHTWLVDGQRVIPDDADWILASSMQEGYSITGFELFGLQNPPAGIDGLAGLEAAKIVSQRLLFPRVANGNALGDGLQQWTGIAVINPNAASANLTYRLYNMNGNLIQTRPKTIGPYMKDIGFANELFSIGDFWGWVTVDSNLPVTGFEVFGYQDYRSIAGVTAFNE